jgi:hypothetical protein
MPIVPAQVLPSPIGTWWLRAGTAFASSAPVASRRVRSSARVAASAAASQAAQADEIGGHGDDVGDPGRGGQVVPPGEAGAALTIVDEHGYRPAPLTVTAPSSARSTLAPRNSDASQAADCM